MTPAPWNISPVRTTEDTAMIVGGEGFEFGLIADVTEDDDAAFIIKAVNNHDALVKALEDIADGMLHFRAPHRLAECKALAQRTLDAVGTPGK